MDTLGDTTYCGFMQCFHSGRTYAHPALETLLSRASSFVASLHAHII